MKWYRPLRCHALRKKRGLNHGIKSNESDNTDIEDDFTEFDVEVEEARMATFR